MPLLEPHHHTCRPAAWHGCAWRIEGGGDGGEQAERLRKVNTIVAHVKGTPYGSFKAVTARDLMPHDLSPPENRTEVDHYGLLLQGSLAQTAGSSCGGTTKRFAWADENSKITDVEAFFAQELRRAPGTATARSGGSAGGGGGGSGGGTTSAAASARGRWRTASPRQTYRSERAEDIARRMTRPPDACGTARQTGVQWAASSRTQRFRDPLRTSGMKGRDTYDTSQPGNARLQPSKVSPRLASISPR
eukprot:TRINITY_DN67752_c0_g1_i1.p2 TRINITY_DN67752_c0_g1~~TRINITY_DN67752_c0_g1_i1.p2  ORF type:complete len:247 (-),score=43.55 TRINITY_DN67752_c0_g1_i1:9-749(-)